MWSLGVGKQDTDPERGLKAHAADCPGRDWGKLFGGYPEDQPAKKILEKTSEKVSAAYLDLTTLLWRKAQTHSGKRGCKLSRAAT